MILLRKVLKITFIATEHLEKHKICGKWVSHVLMIHNRFPTLTEGHIP
jgi:hypothetical protein